MHHPLAQKLVGINKKHSTLFSSPDAQMARQLYRRQHPTRILLGECMDGRINIALATETPLGIMKSFRNIAGNVDLGWPYFDTVFSEEIEYSVSQGVKTLMLITYHFSEGDEHRGCAGFGYNKQASLVYVFNFKAQIERVYGSSHQIVCPVVIGFETDKDEIILHGDDGTIVPLSQLGEGDESAVRKIFKKMPQDIFNDFIPLVRGNLRHMTEIKRRKRPITEVEHRECVLAVGRGFDWLYEPNLALIVGPYDPNLEVPIAKAAGIIRGNMEAGRISNDCFVLLCSSAYTSESGTKLTRAKEKALYMSNLAQSIIKKHHPDLIKVMHSMTVVTNLDTREIKEVKAQS